MYKSGITTTVQILKNFNVHKRHTHTELENAVYASFSREPHHFIYPGYCAVIVSDLHISGQTSDISQIYQHRAARLQTSYLLSIQTVSTSFVLSNIK